MMMKTRSPFLNSIVDYMLTKQYSLRSVDIYLKWIAGFINYHNKRYPSSMGNNEIEQYLDYLVLKKKVSPKNQATTLFSVSERLLWGNGALVKY